MRREMMRIRWLAVLVGAVGLLVLLLSGPGTREERSGPEPLPVETAGPEPEEGSAREGLPAYEFRVLVAPGVTAPTSLDVRFEQAVREHATTKRLIPGRPAAVRLHPAKTRSTLRRGGDGLTLSPSRYDLPARPDGVPIDLLLSASGDLRLILKDGKTDEPIRGFPIEVRGRGGLRVGERTVSDDAGCALFEALPAGIYGVRLARWDRTADPAGVRVLHPDGIFKVVAGEAAEERILLYEREKPTYEVRVEMTVDGRPPPPDLEYRLSVEWRDVGWMLEREAPGRSYGRQEHRLGMSEADEGGVVRVSGPGVKDFRYEFPPGLSTGNRLELQIDVEGHHEEARGILVDDQGRPIPGRTFRLRICPDGNSGYQVREVTTNAVGEFRLPSVSFPVSYQAVNDTPGERLVPSDVRPGRVGEGGVIRIRPLGREARSGRRGGSDPDRPPRSERGPTRPR
jgi:hypothetical protein